MIAIIILIVVVILILASCIKIVPQANAYVVERLGAYQGTWEVGIHFKMPIIDRVAKRVLLKEQVRLCCDGVPDCVVIRFNALHRSGAIDMSRYDMTAKSAVCRHRPLQIYACPST